MWKMLHERNSIEAMAFTMRFVEPLPSVIAKRVSGELQSNATMNGFIDRQPIQGFNVDLFQGGVRQTAPTGIILQRKSVEKQGNGSAQIISNQIGFDVDYLQYQSFRYAGWDAELDALLKNLAAAAKRAVGVVPINSIRLEYLNRFWFDGPNDAALAEPLLKRSDLIAEKIFHSTDMWHSHVGWFEELSDRGRTLKQVNADLQEFVPPHPKVGTRTVALMTAVESQYALPGWEVDADEVEHVLTALLANMHSMISELFLTALNDEFATNQGLKK